MSLAEIAESDAEGAIADLYADIRVVTGLPRVNLIYRHFATIPMALEWAWACLRRHFQSGSISEAAAPLRKAIDQHAGSLIRAESLAEFPPTRTTIRELLDFYLIANPMNLIALTLLGRALGCITDDALSERHALPRARETDLFSEDVESTVNRLAVLLTDGDEEIVPTIVRDLAEWPDYLAHFDVVTRRLCAAPSYRERCIKVANTAVSVSDNIYTAFTASDSAPRPGDPARAEILGFCTRFPRMMIRTTIVIAALRQLVPGAEPDTGSN